MDLQFDNETMVVTLTLLGGLILVLSITIMFIMNLVFIQMVCIYLKCQESI
jgi:hypothetical protein